MKFTQLLLTAVIAIASAVGAVKYYAPQGVQTAAPVEKKETVYERVMRTGKIKCAYFIYEPAIIYDLNTMKLSGIIYDVMENIGKRLNLDIEWAEEVSLGSMMEGLGGRYDMVCSSVWGLANRALMANYGQPLWYSGVGVYVRADDDRFTNNIEAINNKDVKISAVDGTMPHLITKTNFQNASLLSMPQFTDYSFNLVNVANKKADVTFVEAYQGNAFLAKNPGTVKNIALEKPIKLFPNSVMMPKGDFNLYQLINTALIEQLNNGEIDALLDKYEQYPGSFYRVAKPYQTK